MKQLSDKHGVRNLVEICAAKGIQHVVISPGSRNAPLNISFNEHGAFTCLSIPDERCAAFIALGIAQQTQNPVIINCTSGSAALNYAPAISEAYYQKIPLIVLTADRPNEWINQGEGQSIQQNNVYANYILKSYQLPVDTNDSDNLWSNDRMVAEAIDIASLRKGPVHINMPFREPLYGLKDYTDVALPKIMQTIPTERSISTAWMQQIGKEFNKNRKTLVLCGLILAKSPELNNIFEQFSENVVFLSEATANLSGEYIYNNIDALLTSYDPKDFAPDLLITIGHSFISKKIKLWLRKAAISAHWHIGEEETTHDVFQALTHHIQMNPLDFFQNLQTYSACAPSKSKSDYVQLWQKQSEKIQSKHVAFLKTVVWSDLKVYSIILNRLPNQTYLQMGNSSVVRYIQLFPMRGDIQYNGNRGVSGIDGSISTAVGAALSHQNPTTIITGDIAFFYDTNAFWHQHLTANLRIILINNQGGGIFRLIPGPSSTNQLDHFFETTHQYNAKGICDTFHIPYYFADDSDTLSTILPQFYAKQQGNKPAVLEIKTPRDINDNVFKAYYEALGNQ